MPHVQVKVSVARPVHVLWISLERCLGTSPKELDRILRKKVPTVSILTIPIYIPKVPKGSSMSRNPHFLESCARLVEVT